MPESLKQKTIKGITWTFVEQVLIRGVNFLIGIILARLLSPTDYGLVGMLGVFLTISQTLINGGLTSALIQTKNPSDKDFSTVYIVNLVLSFVFYWILFVSAPAIARFYGQPLLKPLLRVISLILVIGAFSSVHGTLLSIRLDFKTKTLISFIASVFSGGIGIFCAYKSLGVWALAAQNIASSIAITILSLLFLRWVPRLVFSKESFKRLFGFSSKILASCLIHDIYSGSYSLVIGKRFTAADLGQFSRAGQFPGIANGTIMGALDKVAYPVLSKVQDDDHLLIRVYDKYIQISCFILFPVLLGICGCARPMVSLLLTDKWLPCVPFMQILCFSFLTECVTKINLNLLFVKGRSDFVLRLEIIKKIIAFSILFISMFFSLKVMCYGQVLNAFIALYLNTHYTKKILGYSFSKQVKSVYPYFLISLIVLAEALCFSSLIQNNWISLGVSVTVGGITYFLLSKLFRLYAEQEVEGYIKQFLCRA
ncbi:MAG: lipopolysaccharide biosynthesis protein [Bacteroidales bacterium]|nr:lipopolysaccharide biosynthesis protein [Bacteroidales bacterium]